MGFSACDNMWIELNCPVKANDYLGILITYAYVAFIKPAFVFKWLLASTCMYNWTAECMVTN